MFTFENKLKDAMERFKTLVKTVIKKAFFLAGIEIRRLSKKSASGVWANDHAFISIFEGMKGKTLLTIDRCYMIYQFARSVENLAGDMAEVGVYKGGSAKLLATVLPGKNFYLFDTFSGMPPVCSDIDLVKENYLSDATLSSLQTYLQGHPNAIFCPGLFPGTAEIINEKRFALVHIDVDIYSSSRECLKFFWDKMVTGGYLIIDDYRNDKCPGVTRAVDEFSECLHLYPIITTHRQCIIIKQQ